MKKMNLAMMAPIALALSLLSGCKEEHSTEHLKFATSADYPPFEYEADGKIVGFDIDLARLVAQELKKEAVFENMQFSTILAALQSGSVQAGISTITTTPDREKNFDFSKSYYQESLAMIYPVDHPLPTAESLKTQKIACQLGTTMEVWLKKNTPNVHISAMDSNPQAIEALKAGHVDGVLVDSAQAIAFTKSNPGLAFAVIAESGVGYAIAVQKGSPLKAQIDEAIQKLEKNGELEKLKKKWFS